MDSPSKKPSKNARKRSLLKERSPQTPFDWKVELDQTERKWAGVARGSGGISPQINSSPLLSSFPRNSAGAEVSVYGNEIIDYLSPFLIRIKSCGDVIATQKTKTAKIKQLLNVPQLVVASIELELPLSLILEYNHMEDDDPRVFQYRSHPLWGRSFVEFGAFLDRFDVNKEVICFIVWSTTQKACICLPNISLNPYPLCWKCNRKFGLMKCQHCMIARYCGKECQSDDWQTHRPQCVEFHRLLSKYITVDF